MIMRSNFWSRLLVVANAAVLLVAPVFAEDFGALAKTYPIEEPDAIELIQARLKQLEAQGKLKEIEEETKERVTKNVQNPKRVEGITTAKMNRSYLFDPTIITNEPIEDGKGNILVPVGTRVNPLEHLDMTEGLIFFDADDSKQVEWATRFLQKNPATKPILVGGPLFDTMKKMQVWLYFDQNGFMTNRLGINAVPAAVKQEGNKLRVDEIAIF